jgi:trimethylamine--corrinoid protein Co-methyltransferase
MGGAMHARTEWLATAERELIIEEALRILEVTGVRLGACGTLDELQAAGLSVDRVAGVMHLPRVLVEETLARIPRRVLLAGATPDDDCVLDGATHFVPSGSPTTTLDFETGQYRSSTLEDVRRAAIVADAMPVVDILWSLVSATDTSEREAPLADLLYIPAWSNKHLQSEVTDPAQVQRVLAMIEILCGSLEAFRERPRFSFVCCTTSPLSVDGALLDATIGVAKQGAPILIYPMPIAGATAPVTVAGTVTMNVAEFLGLASVIELVAPGTPVIMGAGASVLDMKATTFSFGALEAALMCIACVEVGHHLGFPVLAPGLASDAKHPGIQAGFEKALKGLAVASAGADLITGGIGLLAGAGIMSLPQIVIDAEIATMIRRLLAGAEISRDTVMADTMERLGFGGGFLKEKDTAQRLRAGEQFQPGIASRLSLEAWQAIGDDETSTAVERVREIIAAADERGPLLPSDMLRELRKIADTAVSDGGEPAHVMD